MVTETTDGKAAKGRSRKGNSAATVEIKELNDEPDREEESSAERQLDKMNNRDLITSTAKSKKSSRDSNDDPIIHLPAGYVKMRDVT